MEIFQMPFQKLLPVFGISINDASLGKLSVAFQFGRQLNGCGFVLKALDSLSRAVGSLVIDVPER
jgi:hypothetical protein